MLGRENDVSLEHLETARKFFADHLPTTMVKYWLKLVSGVSVSPHAFFAVHRSITLSRTNNLPRT